uniref:Putative ovule protein n=1 Tax=Solanum chacoense TaxID=4108 RepID=A0A0V0H4J2_SOLCH
MKYSKRGIIICNTFAKKIQLHANTPMLVVFSRYNISGTHLKFKLTFSYGVLENQINHLPFAIRQTF